jgi:hypothetical protein
MASMQNQALKALPNVLHDQTVPNRLGGVSQPRPVARRSVRTACCRSAALWSATRAV